MPLLWILFASTSPGQTFGGKATIKPIKGFKAAEPYGSPHETQIKSLLEGGKAFQQPGGKTLLSEGVTLRTYSETNTLQRVITCVECIYDPSTREVSSAGPIQMQTADGKFSIEGTGFLWQPTNSSLVISNQVHTLIQSSGLQSSNVPAGVNGQESGPLVVDSARFTYDGSSGRGVWREHVRVIGTNLVLNSEVLTARVPTVPAEQHQLRSLLAEKNVAVDYKGLHATSGRLEYTPENELIRLTEQAMWTNGLQHGRGDELVLDRTNQIFQVNGHASLYLPGQTLGEGGFLSYTNSARSKSGNTQKQVIEILCDNYEIRTNWAIFRDQVQLNEQLDNTNRGSMTCEKAMTVTFAGTNELQTLTAEKNVIIQEGEKKVTGNRAFYTHTNTTLEVTEHPTWQDGLRSGKGDLLRLNTQQSEMLVQGTASLTLPATELASQFSSLTNATPRPVATVTNQFAQIFCEQYLLRGDKSVFQGGVYATHPEMNVTCENMAILVRDPGITNVIAQQNVVFDLMTAKDKVHGTGDQAVYSFGMLNTITNGILPINELKLTGTPATLVTTNLNSRADPMTSRNDTIILDRIRGKLLLPGSNYTIQGTLKMDTNIFLLPKKKLTK